MSEPMSHLLPGLLRWICSLLLLGWEVQPSLPALRREYSKSRELSIEVWNLRAD